MESSSYQNLIVWKKSVDLVTPVYKITEQYPKSELYGLVNQTRRSAISIPSNIAEGKRRCSEKEFQRFLRISFGSGAELETQLIIAKNLNFLTQENFDKVMKFLNEVMRILNSLINQVASR
jgi:four helix bundle protein